MSDFSTNSYIRVLVAAASVATAAAFQSRPTSSRAAATSLNVAVDPTVVTKKEYQDICGAEFDNDSLQERLKATNFLYPKHVEVIEDIAPIAGAMVDDIVSSLVLERKEVAGGSAAVAAVAPAVGGTAVVESVFNKDNPYTATLLKSHPLVTDEAGRMVVHVEIDLDEDEEEQESSSRYLPHVISTDDLAFSAPTAPRRRTTEEEAQVEWAKAADTVDDVLGDFF